MLLWLWHRVAATALIRPLDWEPPYAAGVALKRQKDQKKKIICKHNIHFSPMASLNKDSSHLGLEGFSEDL